VRKLQKREIVILTILLILISYILYQQISFNFDFDKKNDVQRSPLIEYVNNINLEGSWGIPGFTYMGMTVKGKKDKKYAIEFVSGYCLRSWEVNRTAFYEGDTIVLSRPVQDEFGKKYRKLFTIEYMGEQCLLPFSYAKEFEEEINKQGDCCERWLLRKGDKARTRMGDPNE
jgi:hypothetical protein